MWPISEIIDFFAASLSRDLIGSEFDPDICTMAVRIGSGMSGIGRYWGLGLAPSW